MLLILGGGGGIRDFRRRVTVDEGLAVGTVRRSNGVGDRNPDVPDDGCPQEGGRWVAGMSDPV